MRTVSTTKIFIFFTFLLLAGSAGYVIASPPQVRDETSDWKTYRNEKYGFEMRYPNFYEVLLNQPTKATTISFRDKKYDGSFERPGLSLYFGKVAEQEFSDAELFDIQDVKYEVIRIKFTRGNGSRVYASCALYLDRSTINICNQILSTFKSVPLENKPQVSNIESKESVEYTTPGGISPPLFRALQWLVALLLVGAFLFKLRPNVFKIIFAAIFTIIPPILLGSCFLVDASLPKICEYQFFMLLVLPAYIFGELGEYFIFSRALRSIAVPVIIPFLNFIIWYIIGSLIFTVYRKFNKRSVL